jgi:hypothetical protein
MHAHAHMRVYACFSLGFHGLAHSVQTTHTLLTTIQAALAASELSLARALAQVSLSSESTSASDANISAITPATSGERPHRYCWTHGNITKPPATIQERAIRPLQPPRTRWVATLPISSHASKDVSTEPEGWQNTRNRLIT